MIGIYYHQLEKIILSGQKLRDRNPIFTMLHHPVFKPEEVISVFRVSGNIYVVEHLVCNEEIWASMQKQIWERYSKGTTLSWGDVPHEPDLTFFVHFEMHSKEISARTASALGNLLRLALEQRRLPTEEEREEGEYLHGDSDFFWLPDETCGFAYPAKLSGTAAAVVESGHVLKKYVNGDVSEESILTILEN
jgi:hypothetical protein